MQNKPTIAQMLTSLANNHKLVKEMEISGMKVKRRMEWLREMFTTKEIENQYGYIQSGNKA